jgi:threonine-phosphate decarboxylase
MLSGHGDDGYRHATTVRANFSSNVRPGGLPSGLREHLAGSIERVGVYPEAAAETLTARIARESGVGVENVLVTPGSTAAIYLIAQAFRGERSCVVIPTFGEYEDACVLHAHRVAFLRWEELAAGALPDADLVWLCNPNNPTGAVLPRGTLLALIAARPATLFIVDLAYADFCDEPPLIPPDSCAGPNLVLLHSFTKRCGVPGLRLGFVTGAVETIAALRRFQPPWAVGALELAAGEFLCAPARDGGAGWRAEYLAAARELQRALAAIAGVQVEPSSTGFFLIRLGRRTGAEMKAHLLQQHGLLVRDAGNFRGLDACCVRIAVQRPDENRQLVEAIRRWMQP